MTDPTSLDPMLDDMFAAARTARPEPDAALMARILGDAAELTPIPAPPPVLRPSLWSRIREIIADQVPGGMPGIASLTTCALGGILIGYAGLGDLPLMAGTELLAGQSVRTYDVGDIGDDVSYLLTEDGA